MVEYTIATPSTTPVSLTEAKAHLRVDIDADDTYITTLIDVATEYCEKYHGRPFIQRAVTAVYSVYPVGTQGLALPIEGAAALTSLSYIDENEDTQAASVDDYTLADEKVYPVYDTEWPDMLPHPRSLTIVYTAGYATAAANVPKYLKQAILLVIGHYYENREATTAIAITELPMAVASLLNMGRRSII